MTLESPDEMHYGLDFQRLRLSFKQSSLLIRFSGNCRQRNLLTLVQD
jgi:hypothetical protein